MHGKPEKWRTIVSLAKAEMKKSTRSRVSDVENEDSEDEPMFLSGDEIDADGEGEGEGEAGEGAGETEGEVQAQMRDVVVVEDGKGKDGGEMNVEEEVEAESRASKKGRVVGHDGALMEGRVRRRDGGRARRGDDTVERGPVEEDTNDVSTPAPKTKKARSGKKVARTNEARTAGTRDDGGEDGDTEEIVPAVTKIRKRKAAVPESEPGDETTDASLDAHSGAAGSSKRRRVNVEREGRNAEC